MSTIVVCFGEMLWDILENEELPGGAPMNVAVHLNYSGVSPILISKVGNDELGKRLLEYLTNKGLSTAFVQVDDNHQTGVVQVDASDKTEINYTIVRPVAWDFIESDTSLIPLVKECEAIVFGTLATRNEVSKRTLLSLLKLAKFKVYDVNLRPPHFEQETVELLLKDTNMVKMNHHELFTIAGWHKQYEDEKECMHFVRRTFNIAILIVTRGDRGAIVLDKEGFTEDNGYKITVEDTIGSGDGFLATFLTEYLADNTIRNALKKACVVGALIATQKGATPKITAESIETLMKS